MSCGETRVANESIRLHYLVLLNAIYSSSSRPFLQCTMVLKLEMFTLLSR